MIVGSSEQVQTLYALSGGYIVTAKSSSSKRIIQQPTVELW